MDDYNDPNVLPQDQQDEVNRLEQGGDPNLPKPSDFEDYDQYVIALTDYKAGKVRDELEESSRRREATRRTRDIMFQDVDPGAMVQGAVKDGMMQAWQEQQQAQAQAAQQLTPFPPDPRAGERAEWTKLSMEAGKEAIKAKEAGDIQRYHDWRQRQRQYEYALEKLGPTPEKEYVEAVRDYELEQAMRHITDPSHARDQVWQHPRMKNDAPLAVIEANQRARTTIRLPLEASQYGSLLPCEPKNMATIELDADQMQRFKSVVGSLPPEEKRDPDAVLRKSWAVLHKLGYSAGAKPVMEKKATRKAEGEETDPDKMSWQQFVKWREAQEDKKRGTKRQGFIMPQARRRNG